MSRTCNRCGETKPREAMIIQHRRDQSGNYYYFRPICKECHNARERGHRRDYKTRYLQRWRQQNASLNESYWKGNDDVREAARLRAAARTREEKEAIAIQRRLRKRGDSVTIAEARELLEKYGRCYPTRYGLTQKGLDRCEQIRSRLRARSAKSGRRVLSSFQIRIMVYEESEEEPSLVIAPWEQPIPYEKAAERLRQYHRNQWIIAEI